MDNISQTKTCSKCAATKPLPEFHRSKDRTDGRTNRCRDCANKTSRRLIVGTEEILAARTDKAGPVHPRLGTACWIWKGRRYAHGYGRLTQRGRDIVVHRVSYELFFGPIPPGAYVCHRCDVPLCVNPDHLFLGTQADNMRDMVAKGRQARGARLAEARAAKKRQRLQETS